MMEAEQQVGEPSSSGESGEKEATSTEHAQKSEVETASSTDACKKQPDIANHPLVCT